MTEKSILRSVLLGLKLGLIVSLVAAFARCATVKPCQTPDGGPGIVVAGSCVAISVPTPPTPKPPVEQPPTPPPTIPPTPEPPTSDPTPKPTTPPDTGVDTTLTGSGPLVWVTKFPVRFPKVGVVLYMRNARYGNGVDSTPRIRGDRELCEALHHVPVPNGDCHFDSDVWTDKLMRAAYEGLVLAGARDGLPLPDAPLGPIWQYKAQGQLGRCHDDQNHVNTSCDHFGSAFVDGRDDPKTRPEFGTKGGLPYVTGFEGEPKFLVRQSDEYGPYAGWFMVPQTSGKDFGTFVRACLPLEEGIESTCAPWIAVDWK